MVRNIKLRELKRWQQDTRHEGSWMKNKVKQGCSCEETIKKQNRSIKVQLAQSMDRPGCKDLADHNPSKLLQN
jgi:hypothetical protein